MKPSSAPTLFHPLTNTCSYFNLKVVLSDASQYRVCCPHKLRLFLNVGVRRHLWVEQSLLYSIHADDEETNNAALIVQLSSLFDSCKAGPDRHGHGQCGAIYIETASNSVGLSHASMRRDCSAYYGGAICFSFTCDEHSISSVHSHLRIYQ